MGGVARSEPQLSHALGADLAARRPYASLVPPPHQALRRRPALRSRLSVLRVSPGGQRAGGRPDACQCAARLRSDRQSRLLDRRGPRALRLHHIEAACIPANVASIRLLEKTGFRREGFAREYLCINGVWQDHLLFARLT